MNWLKSIRAFMQERFNLDEDKADEGLIIDQIQKEVQFKGTNLWTLIFAIFIAGRFLPPSTGAPHVGQKVPEFTLSDAKGRQVSLNQLTSEPVDGKAPKGVLLVFYRGWW